MSTGKRPKVLLIILLTLTLMLLVIQVPSRAYETRAALFNAPVVTSALPADVFQPPRDGFINPTAIDNPDVSMFGPWDVYVLYGDSIPSGPAYFDDIVWITANPEDMYKSLEEPDDYGFLFLHWASPDGNLGDAEELLEDIYESPTSFTMPNRDVRLMAVFEAVELTQAPEIKSVEFAGGEMTVFWEAPETGVEPDSYLILLNGNAYLVPSDEFSITFTDMVAGEVQEIEVYGMNRGLRGKSAYTTVTVPDYAGEESPPAETGSGLIDRADLDLAAPLNRDFLKSVNREFVRKPRPLDWLRISSPIAPGPDPAYLSLQRTLRLRPWLLDSLVLDHLRDNGAPRQVTLRLVDRDTGRYVYGGGDLYLSTEGEDGNFTAEIIRNDADHNPIVRELKPGVRYRFGQLLPSPDGSSIPDDYLFYIDNNGQVRDAVTNEKISLSEPDIVTIETAPGIDVFFSVRSTADPHTELAGVSLEINYPSDYNAVGDGGNGSYWFSEGEPMTANIGDGWECTFGLNETMPGYKTPEPIRFRSIWDESKSEYVLSVHENGAWTTVDDNHLVLMLEPSGDVPVKFSVVERGTEQEVAGFSTGIYNILLRRVEDGWNTSDYPEGYEKRLYPGTYEFRASLGPADFALVPNVIFKVEADGNVLVGPTSLGPWTEKPDKLIRLEMVKGKQVTVRTVLADDTAEPVPDVIVDIRGETGLKEWFSTGTEPLQIMVETDVLYEMNVQYNPWSLAASGPMFFKFDGAGQFFKGGAADELAPADNADIVFELSPAAP